MVTPLLGSVLGAAFVFTVEDQRAAIVAAVAFLVVGALALLQRRRILGLLTAREWRLAGKLAAIAGLVILLVLFDIALTLPAEMFIYGRF